MKTKIISVVLAALIGGTVGYLIYLWRGTHNAPYLCAAASAALRFFQIRTKKA